ncbi:hypothetical protein SDC9_76267 [bioreactor metagenome]|uniref:Uncharacterized protein n=1 Tax=bioreactor metagenome TaxID=1076179 RepID=A0A644YN67_9ZZZZ
MISSFVGVPAGTISYFSGRVANSYAFIVAPIQAADGERSSDQAQNDDITGNESGGDVPAERQCKSRQQVSTLVRERTESQIRSLLVFRHEIDFAGIDVRGGSQLADGRQNHQWNQDVNVVHDGNQSITDDIDQKAVKDGRLFGSLFGEARDEESESDDEECIEDLQQAEHPDAVDRNREQCQRFELF